MLLLCLIPALLMPVMISLPINAPVGSGIAGAYFYVNALEFKQEEREAKPSFSETLLALFESGLFVALDFFTLVALSFPLLDKISGSFAR